MSRPMNKPACILDCFSSFLLISLTCWICSCERQAGSGAAVEWPELVAFDELAYQMEGHAKIKDAEGIRGMLGPLLDSGRAVSIDTMPSNVANQPMVEQTLGDLTSLVGGLGSESVPDEELFSLVEGLHPVVEALIEAAGMPHIHANEGPNGGYLHPVFGTNGDQAGTVEIKLHDDAGDIEVWLTRQGHGGPVWDLPVDSRIKLHFPDLKKQVQLAVRDAEENRDESGQITVREGATNYFVFPGETGADASWLMGADFAAKVAMNFDGALSEFILRPHVHAEEEAH